MHYYKLDFTIHNSEIVQVWNMSGLHLDAKIKGIIQFELGHHIRFLYVPFLYKYVRFL